MQSPLLWKGHWRGEIAYKETLHKPAQSVGPGGGGSDACCELAQAKLGPGVGDVNSCAQTTWPGHALKCGDCLERMKKCTNCEEHHFAWPS